MKSLYRKYKTLFFTWVIMFCSAVALAQTPTQQITNFQVTAKTTTSISLSWSAAGDGDSTIVVANASGTVANDPQDGNAYAPNNVFGTGDELVVSSGDYVVFNNDKSIETSVIVTGLTAGVTYQFKAYALNGINGSTEAYNTTSPPTLNVTTLQLDATTQPSNLVASNPQGQSIDLAWDDTGDGDSTIILAHSVTAVDTDPTDGLNYSIGEDIGGGNIVVYLGETVGGGTSATIEGLSSNTVWHFAAYTYNGGLESANYLEDAAAPADAARANATTLTLAAATTTQPTALSADNPTAQHITLNWTDTHDGASTIILMKEGNAVDVDPTDGKSFNVGDTVSNGNIVVYNDTKVGGASTITLWGLNDNTSYHFAAFSYNGSAGTENYLEDGANPADAARANNTTLTLAAAAASQASNFTVSNKTATTLDISWTDDGDGANTIILVKETSAVDADPSNGKTYSADLAFASGDTVGVGNYVVYNAANTGNPETITVTGLTAGTTYHFAVYNFNGSAGTENYLTTNVPVTNGTPAANTSTLAASGPANATISSLANTQNDTVSVFQFTIDDIASDDTQGMDITEMTFREVNGDNGIIRWDEVIAGVVLTDHTNDNHYVPTGGDLVIGATSIQILNIPIGDPASTVGSIAADGDKIYKLKIWLQSDLSGTQNYPDIIDGLDFVFSLDANNDITVNGSIFAATQTAATGNGDNVVDVTATKIIVAQQPSDSVVVDESFAQAPIFRAEDANGNLDLGFTETATYTLTPDLTFDLNDGPTDFDAGVLDFTGATTDIDAVGSTVLEVTTSSINAANSTATNSIQVWKKALIDQHNDTESTPLAGGAVDIKLIAARIKLSTVNDGIIQSITINTTSPVWGKIKDFKLYRSANNSFSTSSDKLLTADTTWYADRIEFTNISGSQAGYYTVNEANEYYYLVGTVENDVTGATPSIQFTWDPTLTVIDGAATLSTSWNSPDYSFADVSSPSIVTLTPQNEALAVPVDATLSILFSEDINRDTDNNTYVRIYRKSDDNLFEEFEAKTATTKLTISNSDEQLNIIPTSNLAQNTTYYITIDDGAFFDDQGNDFPGIDNSETIWEFTTYGLPTIDANGFVSESCVGNVITITGTNFANYPGDDTGVTKVDFCDSAGNNCVSQTTAAKINHVSDTEFTVEIPSGATSGKIKVFKGSDFATSSNDITLGYTITSTAFNPPLNNTNDLNICTGENNLVYDVDNPNDGFTYTWEINGSSDWAADTDLDPVIVSDVNAILVDVRDDASASATITVAAIRDTDGCASNVISYPLVINPEPNVLFDPVDQHSDQAEAPYDLVLLDPTNPLSNGVEGTPPYVSFSGNGVTKTVGDPYIFQFNSNGMPIGDTDIGYVYVDGNNCQTSGAETVTVYDGSSSIPQLKRAYCETNLQTQSLLPNLEGGSRSNLSMVIIDLADPFLTKHPINSGYGLVGVFDNLNGWYDFYFNPTIAKNNIPVSGTRIDLIIEYTYQDAALAIKTKRSPVTVFTNPAIDFVFEDDLVDLDGYQSDGITSLRICADYGEIDLDPNHTVSTPENVRFFAKYLNQTTKAEVDTLDDEGVFNDKFDPVWVDVFTDPLQPEIITLGYKYSEPKLVGEGVCSSVITKNILVYPKPDTPIVLPDLTLDNPVLCAFADSVTEVGITNVFWEPIGKTKVSWQLSSDPDGTDLSNELTFKPALNSLNPGNVNERYVLQEYIDGNFRCSSASYLLPYEYFPNLTNSVDRSILNQNPMFEINISDNTYDGQTAQVIEIEDYKFRITSLNDPNFTPLAYSNVSPEFKQDVNPNNQIPIEKATFTIPTTVLANDLFNTELLAQTVNGCVNTLEINSIFIESIPFPGYVNDDPTKDPKRYNNNFHAGSASWFSTDFDEFGATGKKLSTGTIWRHSTANGLINPYLPNNQQNFWTTESGNGQDGMYLPDDAEAYLISPSFDLTDYDRPMIAINGAYKMFNNVDGVVLQYTTDDLIDENTVWNRVGEINTGINWYNLAGITSNPGDQASLQFGWSSDSLVTVSPLKHQLSNMLGSHVVFRFALATSDINTRSHSLNKPEGFALLDFDIGNRTRTVLVESFGNEYGPTSVGNQLKQIDDFSIEKEADGQTRVVLINYRTPFGNINDEFYKVNPPAHGARVNYYNVETIPTVRIDGLEQTGSEGLPWVDWGPQFYGERSLKLSDFDIELSVTPDVASNEVEFRVDLTAKDTIPQNTVAYLALVYNKLPVTNPEASSGEDSVVHVLKQFLPNASGFKFENDILLGNTETIQYDYQLSDTVNLNDMSLVVFVQNLEAVYETDTVTGEQIIVNLPNEILQADIFNLDTVDFGLITGIEDIVEVDNIKLYPNPTSSSVNLVFPKTLNAENNLRLFDNFGREVWNGIIYPGERAIQIKTTHLANGVYTLQILQGNKYVGAKRLLIKH